MTDTVTESPAAAGEKPPASRWSRFIDFTLSPNPGKRAAEKWYFCWFLITLPFQKIITSMLSFDVGTSNDALLVTQGVIMGVGAWGGSVIFRAKEDKGKPFYEVYGFKLGCFLFVWAVIGGYLGTDPWYEVLHGHFAFNTDLNPNGVPLFMLPMTIAVFGFYTVILGALYRMAWRRIERPNMGRFSEWSRRTALILPLAVLMPLIETVGYTSDSYCFDDKTGMWWFNILIYGSWQASALIFYPRFDEKPGEDQPVGRFVVTGFAVVAVVMFSMQIVTEFVAPHFTDVHEGARYVNDWSSDNCLGPRPGSETSGPVTISPPAEPNPNS